MSDVAEVKEALEKQDDIENAVLTLSGHEWLVDSVARVFDAARRWVRVVEGLDYEAYEERRQLYRLTAEGEGGGEVVSAGYVIEWLREQGAIDYEAALKQYLRIRWADDGIAEYAELHHLSDADHAASIVDAAVGVEKDEELQDPVRLDAVDLSDSEWGI